MAGKKSQKIVCPVCNGSGKMLAPRLMHFNPAQMSASSIDMTLVPVSPQVINGEEWKKCSTCHGKGMVKRSKVER